MPANKVAIIGHRGARDLWPENSLDGFQRTRALGIEGVEFDVHLARDGELVVIHDLTLERTTERHGGGAGIPTLDQVLDVFTGSDIELHIEIKTDASGKLYPGLEKRLVDVIA